MSDVRTIFNASIYLEWNYFSKEEPILCSYRIPVGQSPLLQPGLGVRTMCPSRSTRMKLQCGGEDGEETESRRDSEAGGGLDIGRLHPTPSPSVQVRRPSSGGSGAPRYFDILVSLRMRMRRMKTPAHACAEPARTFNSKHLLVRDGRITKIATFCHIFWKVNT